MIRPVRRVIATEDDGVSRIVEDAASPHVHTLDGMPESLGLTDLWYTGPNSGDHDGAARELAIGPDPGGTLFRIVQFPPDAALPVGTDGEPALLWHATDTVDYNVVLAGEITFLAERGEVVLYAGDTLVVQGGRHAWSNRTGSPAVLAAVSVSAQERD